MRIEDIRNKVGVAYVVDKKRVAKMRYEKRSCTNTCIRRCERLSIVGMRRGKGRLEKYLEEVIR